MSSTFISQRLDDVPVRTDRANDIIRRDPREIPRRLRGLMLALNNKQPVRTYVETLEGFGDIQALMAELATLGLIEFRSGRRMQGKVPDWNDSSDGPGESSLGGVSSMEAMLADPAHLFQTFAETTVTGTFDDLVRVAQIDNREYKPPPPTPSAPRQSDVAKQVESLFGLLESVRGERRALKERISSLRRHRERADRLEADNTRLTHSVYLLSASSMLVVGLLILAIFLRR